MVDNRLIEYLSSFLTDRRKKLIDTVLSYRTRYVTLLMEDIYQSQNASAVLRTAECYGVQDIHVIENKYNYQYNPDVAVGAGKWIHLHRYSKAEVNNTNDAVIALKNAGYRIVATAPGGARGSLQKFDISAGKFAIAIGSERHGLSPFLMENADEIISLPMFGFTESFNLSVSVALILDNLMKKIHCSDIDWELTQNERNLLLLEWYRLSIKKPELIEEQFYKLNRISE